MAFVAVVVLVVVVENTMCLPCRANALETTHIVSSSTLRPFVHCAYAVDYTAYTSSTLVIVHYSSDCAYSVNLLIHNPLH